MKRFVRTLLFTAALTIAGPAVPAHAQIGAVTKVTGAIDDAIFHVENLASLARIWNNGTATIKQVEQTMNTVDDYITRAKVYTEIVQNFETVQYDVKTFRSLIEDMQSGGEMSLSRAKSYWNTLSFVSQEAAEEIEYIKDIIMASNKSLSKEERLKKLEEANKKFEQHHYALAEMKNAMIKNWAKNAKAKTKRSLLTDGFGYALTSEDIPEAAAIAFPDFAGDAKRTASQINEKNGYDKSSADKLAEELKGGGKSNPYINIAYPIICILGAIYMVINWHRYNKSEPQHRDALWKTFAGLIASLLILRVIETMFFN